MRSPVKLLFPSLLSSLFLFCAALFAQVVQEDPVVQDVQAAQETPGVQEEAAVTGFCRTTEAQNLWSGPSKNFKKVREVPAGHLLQVIGEKGE